MRRNSQEESLKKRYARLFRTESKKTRRFHSNRPIHHRKSQNSSILETFIALSLKGIAATTPMMYRASKSLHKLVTRCSFSSLAKDRKVVSNLEQDAYALFREKQGNLWPYLYGAPEHENDKVDGGRLYVEALKKAPEYYLYDSEAQLFQSHSRHIAEIVGSGATVIELGPGSKESVAVKTIPLLQSLPALNGYIAIDISLPFVEKTLDTIRSALPHISVQGYEQDFTQLSALPQQDGRIENPVLLFKGSTIANMRPDEATEFISKLPALIGGSHYFLVVQDCNQDVDSLMQAYGNPTISKILYNLMFRLQRDAPSIRFDPNLFRYTPKYDPNTYDFMHVLSATADQTVDLGDDTTVSVRKGDRFKMLSSYKYPVNVFQDMVARTALYSPIDVFTDEASGNMVCHVFKSN